MAGGDDLVNEGRPVVRPFLLEDGDEDQVELVEKRSLAFETLFRARALDDEAHDEVTDPYMWISIPGMTSTPASPLTLTLLPR